MIFFVSKVKAPVWLFLALLALVVSGCSSKPAPRVMVQPATTKPVPVITPDFSLAAKVVSVNNVGRFVVLSFPASAMPKIGLTMFLYREGLKVAEIHISGPQQNNEIIADMVSGDAQVGDTVSDK
jgi:hypothetical protein